MLDLRNLCVLAYANDFTLWSYRTTDALVYAVSPGYFNGAGVVGLGKGFIHVGDKIEVSSGRGGISLFVKSVGDNVVEVQPWG